MPPAPRRYKTQTGRSGHALKSIGTLKKKIRDAERLLQRPNNSLSADGRLENERALAAFKLELTHANQSKNEQKMAKKYHMVRFFERQKATRRLNKLQKELAAFEESAPEDLQERVHNAQVELNYTLHYPRGERYISLFKDPGNNTDAVEKRDMIKKDIALRMKSKTLGVKTIESISHDEEQEDDESRRAAGTGKEKKDKNSGRERKKTKRKAEPNDVQEDNIENDDFFEF